MRNHSLQITMLLMTFMGFIATASEKPVTAPESEEKTESPSRISDEKIPLVESQPERPKPPIEWGDKLLGQGPIGKGFQLPTGAVWQPSLWAFGSIRSAFQTFDSGLKQTSEDRPPSQTTEWANRMDLFTNLRLSGTERIVLGVRPLDKNGVFSGYQNRPSGDWTDGSNLDVRSLYFEGDLSEIFPRAGQNGGQPKQLGFVIGRQPLFIQEGIMINDSMDAVGITRNNIPVRGTSNFRLSFLFGWNDVNRHNNIEDQSAKLFAVMTEIGTYKNLYNIDFAYINAEESTGSGAYAGISRVRSVGHINWAIRLNTSYAIDEESASVSDGALIFNEVSWTPPGTENLWYINAFLGIDQYKSASRAAAVGGPMGRNGLLFAAVGLGSYKAALGNQANDSFGTSTGYQHFFNVRRQLIIEVGGRTQTEGASNSAYALGSRFQQALGRHFVVQADAFFTYQQSLDDKFGTRVEVQYKY